jgi:WD40-like Beta Propeller Repeat
MTDRERLLRDALQDARADDEQAAEDRAWRVVAAAATGTPAVSRRHRWRAVQVATVLALVALVVSPAGASVRHWVADRIDESGAPRAKPVLSSLPGDGSLLVDSAEGPWVVHPDGSRRLLGDWSEASWSPHGLFAVVTKGHELAAVEPDGTVRWALSRPGSVDLARWNGPDGFRIAYLEGHVLRVVDGEGGDDRRVAAGAASVAPAWRPGPTHVLAYARADGAVVAVGADSRHKVFATRPGDRVTALQWVGGDLLVTRRDRLQLLDDSGSPLWTWTPPPGSRLRWATTAPDGRRFATVIHEGRSSRVLLLSRDHRSRVLFAGPGSFAAPRWSPDGRWLLLPWPSADQWLFLHSGGGPERLHAVANVAAQFSPGQSTAARFPTVTGWR